MKNRFVRAVGAGATRPRLAQPLARVLERALQPSPSSPFGRNSSSQHRCISAISVGSPECVRLRHTPLGINPAQLRIKHLAHQHCAPRTTTDARLVMAKRGLALRNVNEERLFRAGLRNRIGSVELYLTPEEFARMRRYTRVFKLDLIAPKFPQMGSCICDAKRAECRGFGSL